MARKPPVSLRKPPAAVDLTQAEAFVQQSERPSVRPSETPKVLPSEPSDVSTSAAPAPVKAARKPRAAKPRKPVSKSVVARVDGRTLRRMTVYLPDDLARKLAVYSAREDREISAVVTEAVQKLLGRARTG